MVDQRLAVSSQSLFGGIYGGFLVDGGGGNL